MSRRAPDLTGKKIGRLTVLRLSDKLSGVHKLWICRCACGRTHEAQGYRLRHNLTSECTECWKESTSKRRKAAGRKLSNGKSISEVARALGITKQALHLRIKRGWRESDLPKFGKHQIRPDELRVVIPCHICGEKVPKDPIKPWASRGPCCRACFIEIDKADEAEMFMAMACPAPYLPEDPEELGSLVTARVVSGGYVRKAPSGKTLRRQEFYVEKTEVHGDKVTGAGPSYDVAVYSPPEPRISACA